MRLWHHELLPFLLSQRILGQHRECCALRGHGWGKKHATVDYVFDHNPMRLFSYHRRVMHEFDRRGFHITEEWRDPIYRGQYCEPWDVDDLDSEATQPYTEHDDTYLRECLDILNRRGVSLTFDEVRRRRTMI